MQLKKSKNLQIRDVNITHVRFVKRGVGKLEIVGRTKKDKNWYDKSIL